MQSMNSSSTNTDVHNTLLREGLWEGKVIFKELVGEGVLMDSISGVPFYLINGKEGIPAEVLLWYERVLSIHNRLSNLKKELLAVGESSYIEGLLRIESIEILEGTIGVYCLMKSSGGIKWERLSYDRDEDHKFYADKLNGRFDLRSSFTLSSTDSIEADDLIPLEKVWVVTLLSHSGVEWLNKVNSYLSSNKTMV